MKMTGRPGQTRPLAKERENEENISLVEDKKNREDIAKAEGNTQTNHGISDKYSMILLGRVYPLICIYEGTGGRFINGKVETYCPTLPNLVPKRYCLPYVQSQLLDLRLYAYAGAKGRSPEKRNAFFSNLYK